jgi:hypothetical protein
MRNVAHRGIEAAALFEDRFCQLELPLRGLRQRFVKLELANCDCV